ncbi:MAG: hypothetical protein JO270_03880 [Acidobacteriaceae bacterium]|nr:hypothetical protein [Acidobacteriaceae bacterium]MBV8572602.1 hypothetical protein [Acidobacteriaceae bacterium]
MKVNPDSPDFQPPIESTTTASQTGKTFGETLTSKSQPNAAAGASETPAAPLERLSKEDLTDPVKVNAAIDRAVQDLLQSEFGRMCAPDREQVAAWLRSDPMIRAALLQRMISST